MGYNETSTQDYVELLLTEGETARCDNTNDAFVGQTTLPSYYNDRLFKRGQRLFYKHVYAIGVAQIFGLVAAYAVPSLLNVVRSTKRNDSALQSYRRQIQTFFLLEAIYKSNIEPDSKLWKAIKIIKSMHNSASKCSIRAGFNPVNQKDMALSQFVFIGFPLARSELCGIYGVTKEEWEGFNHFWRVVGYLLGIEERFNLCSFPVKKTVEICDILIEKIFRPGVMKRDERFLEMSEYLCTALSIFSPEITVNCGISHVANLVQKKNKNDKLPEATYFPMNWFQKFHYKAFVFMMVYLMRWSWFRFIKNIVLAFNLILIKVFPVMAFIKFGILNGYVDIKF